MSAGWPTGWVSYRTEWVSFARLPTPDEPYPNPYVGYPAGFVIEKLHRCNTCRKLFSKDELVAAYNVWTERSEKICKDCLKTVKKL